MSPLLCDRSSPEQTRICLFQIPGCPHRPTQVKRPFPPLCPSQRPDNSSTSSNLILTITLLTWCWAHSCIGTFKKRNWGSEWLGVGCSGLPSSKAELRWNCRLTALWSWIQGKSRPSRPSRKDLLSDFNHRAPGKAVCILLCVFCSLQWVAQFSEKPAITVPGGLLFKCRFMLAALCYLEDCLGDYFGSKRASLVAQTVKNLLAM